MKALVSVEGKKAEVQTDIAIPKPGPGEILVRVHTVAQNPTDWKAVAMVPPGRTIGCDFVSVFVSEDFLYLLMRSRPERFTTITAATGRTASE